MSKAKTQTRGICPCCGNEQAVLKSGRMSKHGYTVEHGWFEGTCQGQNHVPLNEDRTVTDQIITDIARQVVELEQQNAKLESGEIHPKTVPGHRRDERVDWSAASDYQRRQAVQRAIRANQYRVRVGRDFAKYLGQQADTFHGQPLRIVEKDTGPAPIRWGEKRRTDTGLVLTCDRVERGRVYYTYQRNDRTMKSWEGLASWRKKELIK